MSKNFDFSNIFGNNNNNKSSARKAKQQRRGRTCLIEELESREMLSADLFNAINAAYGDLNLGNDWEQYNYIEIQAGNLTDAAIRNAITAAGGSEENDIIVVHTTETQNTISLSATELAISINAATHGSVMIVSLGDVPLTIQQTATNQRVLNVAANANVTLAGLTITGGNLTSTDSAMLGGGIQNAGNLTLTHCEVVGNQVSVTGGNVAAQGGGIYSTTGNLTITNSVVSGNQTYGQATNGNAGRTSLGGGIYVAGGSLTMTNSTIAGNISANGVSMQGGGIYIATAVTSARIYNSIIVGNVATTAGADLYNQTRNPGTNTGSNNLIGAIGGGTGVALGDFGATTATTAIFATWLGTPSEGNTGTNFNADAWDFSLAASATAAHKGGDETLVNGTVGTVYYDVAGNARANVDDGTVSIGAYQYEGETINKADYTHAVKEGWIYNDADVKLTWGAGTEIGARRITEIEVTDATITTLDLTGLAKLEKANLEVCDDLEELTITGTALKFSTIHLPDEVAESFVIVGTPVLIKIDEKQKYGVGGEIDLSSEWNVREGETTYTWYYANSDEGTGDVVVDPKNYDVVDGEFTFNDLDRATTYGSVVYCVITNNDDAFAGLKLQTTNLTLPTRLVAPSLIDPLGHTDDTLTVHWNLVVDADEYEIQWREKDSSDPWDSKKVSAVSHYSQTGTIEDLDAETEYEVRVKAIPSSAALLAETHDESYWSESIFLTTAALPVTISRPEITDSEQTATTITITWGWAAGSYTGENFTVECWDAIPGTPGKAALNSIDFGVIDNSEPGTFSLTIYGLDAKTTYYFRVMVKADGDEAWSEVGDPLTTLDYNSDEVARLNAIFGPGSESDWAEQYITATGDADGRVIWEQVGDEMRVVSLDVSDMDLSGTLDVTVFERLVAFDCSDNNLTALTITGLTALESLDVSGNKLTALTVAGFSALKTLDVSGNKLTALNVSTCVALETLSITDCDLTFATLILRSSHGIAIISEGEPTKITMNPMDSAYAVGRDIDFTTYAGTTVADGYAVYTWYKVVDGGDDELEEGVDYTISNDVFTIADDNEALVGATIYCVITAPYYGGLTLQTSEIKVFGVTPEDLDANAWDVLENSLKEFFDDDTIDFEDSDIAQWSDDGKLVGLDLSDLDFSEMDDEDLSNLLNSLTDLEELDLSGIQGVEELDLSNLTNLKTLEVQDSSLVTLKLPGVGVDDAWIVENDLEDLDISNNNLTKLDVSGCPNLITLNVSGNPNLAELIFTSETDDNKTISSDKLEILDCSGCALENLDVSILTCLTELNVSGNPLTQLDLTGLDDLTTLNVDGTNLTFESLTLPVGFAGTIEGTIFVTAAYEGQADNLPLPSNWSVDLSEFDGTGVSYAWYKVVEGGTDVPLTPASNTGGVFTFTGLAAGDDIYCKITKLGYDDMALRTHDIKISGATPEGFNTEEWLAIVEILKLDFDLEDGDFDPEFDGLLDWDSAGHLIGIDTTGYDGDFDDATIDLALFTALKTLNLSGLATLTTVDVSDFVHLEELICSDLGLTALTVNGCIALKTLDCSGNDLTTLNVSGCAALETLDCSDNSLETLNVSDCAALETLDCSDNSLETLNVSGCVALETLDCSDNGLTTLNVSGCVALETLDCSGNSLTTLNVSSCVALETLDCSGNGLTTLNVSGCVALEMLDCSDNGLTTLNVSDCEALETLDCSDNGLTTLNVSDCEALETLDCSGNRLKFSALELPGPITTFDGSDQQTITIPGSVIVNVAVNDLATEYLEGDTVYKWYYMDGTRHDLVEGTDYTNVDGVFKFTNRALLVGKTLVCEMTNPAFPGMTLTTSEIKIEAPTPLAQPEIGTSGHTQTTFTVHWDAIDNAHQYFIEWSVNDFATVLNSKTVTSEETSYEVGFETGQELVANTTYHVRVTALANPDDPTKEDSPVSDKALAKTADPDAERIDAPELTMGAVGQTTIAISWTKIDAADGYKIEWTSNESGWTGSGHGSHEVDKDTLEYVIGLGDGQHLIPGTTYYVRVTALASEDEPLDMDSVPSNVKEAEMLPADVLKAPDITLASTSPTTITVTWDEVDDADGGYLIEWSVDNFATEALGTKTVAANVFEFVIGSDTALTPGTTYSVRVTALADEDDVTKVASVPSTVKDIATPKVTIADVTNIAADDSVADTLTITWTNSANHDDVDQYVVEIWTKEDTPVKVTGATANGTDGVTGVTFNIGTDVGEIDLLANTEYEIRITAKATAGSTTHDDSAVAEQTFTYLKAFAPNQVATPTASLVSGTTNIKVDWDAPAAVAGTYGEATHYEIEYRIGEGEWQTAVESLPAVEGTAQTYTFGVDAPGAYTFRVTAINGTVVAVPSEASNAVNINAPSIPGDLSESDVTANSVTLSWNASAEGTNPITYKIQYMKGTTWTDLPDAPITISQITGTATRTATISGLTAGTYKFQVVATNAVGSTPSDQPVEVTIPSLEVNRVETPTAAREHGTMKIKVDWDAPVAVDEIYGEATHYKIEYRVDTGVWKTAVESLSAVEGTAQTYTFDVDAPGAYTFRVTAIYATVSAAYSDTSNAVEFIAPGIPGNPSASNKTTNSVTLSWDASTSVIEPISYKIQYMKGPTWTDLPDAPITISDISETTPLTATISGLTAGTYEFRVVAMNADGNTPSDQSVEVTIDPLEVDQVKKPTAVRVNETMHIKVDWDAPAAVEGTYDEATHYKIEYRVNEGEWETAVELYPAGEGTAQTYTFTGVSDPGAYTFRVTAINGTVSAEPSEASDALVFNAPGIPGDPSASNETVNRVTLSWDASTGTDPITYKIQYMKDTTWTDLPDASASITISPITGSETLTATISGLTAGTYEFQVVAMNDFGSTPSDQSVVVTIDPLVSFEVPDGLIASDVATDSFVLSWNGTTDATGYEVMVNGGVLPDIFTETTATIVDLTAGTQYTFQVRAVYAGGKSDWTETQTVSTNSSSSTVPATPLRPMVAVATTPDSLTVSWSAVPGATTYEIRYRITTNAKGKDIADNKNKNLWVTQIIEIDSSSVTVTGLTANAGYQFQVRAVNAIGKSNWSQESTVAKTTAAVVTAGNPDLTKAKFGTKPKAVPNTTAVDSATLSWGVVANATSYVITYTIPSGVKGVPGTTISKVLTGDELTAATSGTMVTYQIEGLRSSTSYKISIVAKNASGTTTKAATAKVKTVKVPAIKKIAKTTTTISSITLQVLAGAVPPEFGAVRAYIVQVYAPKPKSGEWQPVKAVAFDKAAFEAGQTIDGLKASTKYTFAVMATNFSKEGALMDDGTIKTGQKLSAVKTVSAATAKYPDAKFKQVSFSPTEIVMNVTLPKNPIAGAYESFQLFNSSGILVATASGAAVSGGKVTFTGTGFTVGKYTVKAVILDELGNVLQSSVKGAKITMKA